MITPSFSLTATERVLPKLALDFTTASLDSRVTFTRTTDATHPATYVDSNGYITAVTNDQPRFDYDPIALVCKGLLVEEARTNSLTYSEDFSAATGAWTNTRLASTTNSGTSPDGLNNANAVIEDSSTTNTHLLERTVSFTAGTPYTFSGFFKANGRNWVRLFFGSAAFGSNTLAFFDCQNGVLGTTFNTPMTTIQDFGNGWYRFSISKTATVTASAPLRINLSDGDNAVSYSGDGVSGIYIWGAQLEAGAFPTSYIPTTTAALTRNADVATMTGTNFSDWFNATEGTFVASGTTPEGIGTLFTANDGTNTNYIALLIRTDIAGFSGLVVNSSINQVTIGPQLSTNTYYNMALAYKHDDFALSYDGNSPYIDTAGSIPTVDRLQIAALASDVRTVTISKLSYYPMRLKNAEVIAFSK